RRGTPAPALNRAGKQNRIARPHRRIDPGTVRELPVRPVIWHRAEAQAGAAAGVVDLADGHTHARRRSYDEGETRLVQDIVAGDLRLDELNALGHHDAVS